MRYWICSWESAIDLGASRGEMSHQLSRLLPTPLGGDGGRDGGGSKGAGLSVGAEAGDAGCSVCRGGQAALGAAARLSRGGS